jgi:hypothetical protein
MHCTRLGALKSQDPVPNAQYSKFWETDSANVRIVYSTMVFDRRGCENLLRAEAGGSLRLSQLATGPPAVTFGRPESGTLSQTGRAPWLRRSTRSMVIMLVVVLLHLSVPKESRLIRGTWNFRDLIPVPRISGSTPTTNWYLWVYPSQVLISAQTGCDAPSDTNQ